MIFIMAQNYQQAYWLAGKLGLDNTRQFVFLEDAQRLAGARDITILRWEDYWAHPRYREIMQAVELQGLLVLDIDYDEMRRRYTTAIERRFI